MSTLVTLFQILVAVYRLIATLWNATIVLLRVVQSVMQEAKQEATELLRLLDHDAPVVDAITSTSLLQDAGGPAQPWQILIIAKASSFVLLLRLSEHRVLHLEVDETFIIAKLEVIRSELALHVQHIPRLLQMPIGMHDTRLIRYTPTRLPYLWREEPTNARVGAVEPSSVPVPPASSVSTGVEGDPHRKKCIQLLTEGALRRRLRMDRLGRVGTDDVPKRGARSHENAVRRKTLANMTNLSIAHGVGSTVTEADRAPDEAYGPETDAAGTPKRVRVERNLHAVLSENLSIPSTVQASSSRKAVESVQRPRRMEGSQSLRRKRGQFDLYAQRSSSEFSLLSMVGQGRE